MGSEEAGLAVWFGFGLVAGPAAGLEVGVLGGAVVGYGVDVVVLESPAAAAIDAGPAGEGRYRSEVECGAQGGGQVAAEVLDGVIARAGGQGAIPHCTRTHVRVSRRKIHRSLDRAAPGTTLGRRRPARPSGASGRLDKSRVKGFTCWTTQSPAEPLSMVRVNPAFEPTWA